MTDRSKILGQIRGAGVVGAGGAGFPTYKKLDAQVECIIANGAECEPLLQKDRETIRHRAAEMLRGLELMQQVTGATRVVVAVKQKNEDVARLIETQINSRGFELFVYEDVYPAGDEYVLVYEITRRQIPPGGIPLDVDCLVDNVETIANVANAVDGDPVTDKWVTVCGGVANPQTISVPVGVSLADCIQLAGGPSVDNPVALLGGVMMGGTTDDFSLPVTKATGGIIVLPEDHYLYRRKTQPRSQYTRIGHGQCDQCSLCTELCPRYILGYPIQPHMVMRSLMMTGDAKDRNSLWSQYCCECNVCSFVACPEQLDPARICADAKSQLRENKQGRTEEELEQIFREPHPARKGRELPISTLYRRLGLTEFESNADFVETNWQPATVTIPLNTHIGKPATPTVKVGDAVKRGDVIGDVPESQLGCPVHASINGRVSKLGEQHIELTA